MQQFQVSKNKQINNPAQLYNQFQVRSPFTNVENKGAIQKTASDLEMMNKPVPPTKSLMNQQTPNASEYKIQFKVGGAKQQNLQDDASQFNSCAQPFIPMSPQQRHENTQILQSPQQLRQGYMLSPQNMMKFNQMQFQSPNNREQKQQLHSQVQPLMKHEQQPQQIIQPTLQQPTLQQPTLQQPPLQQQKSQKVINFTNTFALTEELKQIQLLNNQITQEIQKLESLAVRGQSATCIKELEEKIRLLTQLNKKLQDDNQELMKVPDIQALRDLIIKYQNDRKHAYSQLTILKNELLNQKAKCDDIETKLKSNESSALNDIVQELDNKVQTLILENDRINLQLKNSEGVCKTLIKQRNENELIKEKLIKLRKEEEYLKQQYSKSETKLNLYKDCNEKVLLLQEENQRLQQSIQESEITQNDLDSLIDKISVIRQDNERMMKQLKTKS